ncbi:TraX family protein [Oribacterium sp. NK2B42]|uniref:TraX family protein n=1 Tax=Oribacterium sp. NK2B42 TaxID=689781 RepID=UPI0004037B68|nr:TraX family protein [Oribacterium sp. NK2B42]
MLKLSKNNLRWLAILFMVLDHFAEIFLNPGLEGNSEILTKLHLSQSLAATLYDIFVYLGTFTGTAMIYFLIEGYFYTKDVKKYMKRLLLFGLLGQIPFYLAFRIPVLNMLFALAACLCVIYVHYHIYDSAKRRLMIFGLFIVNCFTDWTMLAVPFTLFLVKAFEPVESGPGFRLDQKRLKFAWCQCFFLILLVDALSESTFLKALASVSGFVLAAVLITRFYDDKVYKPSNKWFFYIFYPLHLMIFWIIFKLI